MILQLGVRRGLATLHLNKSCTSSAPGLRELHNEGVNGINLAQDVTYWRALVHTLMSLRVLWQSGNFWPTG
jgi:hypothetical protein